LGWVDIEEFFPKVTNPKLNEMVRNLEKDQEFNRAATLCVLHFDFDRALEALSNDPAPTIEANFLKSILKLLQDWQ